MHLINCVNKVWQVTVIDIETEKDRQDRFCSLSYTDFRTDAPVSADFFTTVKSGPVEELADINEVSDDSELQALRDKYEEVLGKAVPARYKNDAERLNNKINEVLNPA